MSTDGGTVLNETVRRLVQRRSASAGAILMGAEMEPADAAGEFLAGARYSVHCDIRHGQPVKSGYQVAVSTR
jgi:hypothetical protein